MFLKSYWIQMVFQWILFNVKTWSFNYTSPSFDPYMFLLKLSCLGSMILFISEYPVVIIFKHHQYAPDKYDEYYYDILCIHDSQTYWIFARWLILGKNQ